ncbi:MAG: SusC/RagA family TonB-linked outer membrane protein [Candidatus Cryptobacteroides sp.]
MEQRKTVLAVLLLSVLIICHIPLSAQVPRASVHKENVPVKEILKTIEKATDYVFFWNAADFDASRKVSVNMENTPVTDIISTILPGFECRIDKGKIILVKAAGKNDAYQKSSPVRKPVTLKGRILDDEQAPLPGAAVVVRLDGRSYGTTADVDGNFILDLPSEPEIGCPVTASFIGYLDKTASYNGSNTFEFILRQDEELLSESVVVGYGRQEKINLTGSVAAISSDNLTRRPVMRATASLAGLASGVSVTQTSGQPGSDGATVRIRGIGTLNNSAPLVLIDGISGQLDGINPNDIESISILKDAASSAIYGSRAANGVILVTTKEGTQDRISVTYNGYAGFQSPTALPDFVSNYEYMENINKAYANEGKAPLYSEQYIADWLRYRKIDPDHYPDNDWQKLLMTGSGFTQNHHISVSAGSKHFKGFASFAYQSQDGIMENFSANRYSLRSNISADVTKWLTAGLLVDGRRSTTESPSYQSNMKSAINRIPGIYTCILTDGRWGTGYNQRNALALGMDGGLTTAVSDNLRATFSVGFKPVKGLDIDFKWTPNLTNSYKKVMRKTVAMYEPDLESPAAEAPALSSLSQSDDKTTMTTLQVIANYSKEFRRGHKLNILAGYEQIDYQTKGISLAREGFILPEYEVMDAGSAENMSNGGDASSWALLSGFARVNWSYRSRYLLEANVRADGSSRFAKGNRYGVFPSFSAGWRISEEPFLRNAGWLNNLKIRVSWGLLGNQEIGTYPAYATIKFNPSYAFGGKPADGGYQTAYANSGISWESSETVDAGIDLSLFGNKLTASFDWYRKNTTDILLKLPIPNITGLTEPYQNAGVVRNTGWDLEIGHKNSVKDFSYSISFNLSDVYNKVIDLKGAGPIISGYTVIDEGYPINSLYGYKSDGLFRNRVELINHPSQKYFGNYSLGDIRYVNVSDEDGTENVINAYDRTIIGNQIPRLIFGLNFSAEWKWFDLSLMFQGIGKRDIILTGDAVWALYNGGKMQTWMKDNWSVDNPDASYPRLIASSSHNNYQYSDFWVYNAAFLRLKTAQLGFSFPEKWVSRMRISNLRIYVTGDNILTLSSLPKGWDPEMGSGAADIYPLTKTWLFGLQLTF